MYINVYIYQSNKGCVAGCSNEANNESFMYIYSEPCPSASAPSSAYIYTSMYIFMKTYMYDVLKLKGDAGALRGATR